MDEWSLLQQPFKVDASGAVRLEGEEILLPFGHARLGVYTRKTPQTVLLYAFKGTDAGNPQPRASNKAHRLYLTTGQAIALGKALRTGNFTYEIYREAGTSHVSIERQERSVKLVVSDDTEAHDVVALLPWTGAEALGGRLWWAGHSLVSQQFFQEFLS